MPSQVFKNTCYYSCRLLKKVQMQGGAVPAGRQEEARSETYLDVRCNDERSFLRSSAGFARASSGEVRKGGVPPSEGKPSQQMGLFQQPVKESAMPQTILIDTNKLPRQKTPQGE